MSDRVNKLPTSWLLLMLQTQRVCIFFNRTVPDTHLGGLWGGGGGNTAEPDSMRKVMRFVFLKILKHVNQF